MSLIEKEPIMKFIEDGLNNKHYGHVGVEIITEVEYAPAIDAVPVVHSKWLLNLTYNPSNTFRVSYDGWMHCPVCAGAFRRIVGTQLFNYCPTCGAKMDGEAE